MSQAGRLGGSGGGGGGSVDGLRPDSGAVVTATASAVTTSGQAANSAQVISTSNNGANVFKIEDRVWVTPYVVDPSTTVGLRGTFTTIQAAIDAAIADGVATASNFGVIDLRMHGLSAYTENLTIPSAIRICIRGPVQGTFEGSQPVFIEGFITVGVGGTLQLQDVGVDNSGSDTFSNSGEIVLVNSIVPFASGTGGLTAYNSSLPDLRITGGQFECYNCDLQSSGFGSSTISGSTTFVLHNCFGGDNHWDITLDDTCHGVFTDCDRVQITGDTTGAIRLNEISIYSAVNLPNAVVSYNSIVLDTEGTALEFFVAPARKFASSAGNVLVSRTSSGSDTVSLHDQMVFVDTSGGTSALDINTSNMFVGQQVVIVDINGNAGTNAISIAPTSGLINGKAIIFLGIDYSWAVLTFDGTDFFAQTGPQALNFMSGKNVTLGTPAFYNVTFMDYFIGVNNTLPGVAGQIIFDVPAGFFADQIFVIKDIAGNAGTNFITIFSTGGILFDGAASILLNTNYSSVTLRFDGANMNIIGRT